MSIGTSPELDIAQYFGIGEAFTSTSSIPAQFAAHSRNCWSITRDVGVSLIIEMLNHAAESYSRQNTSKLHAKSF